MVCRGPAPRTESRVTQVSPEVLVVALKDPSPQLRKQLPPPSGGGAPAVASSQDGITATAVVPVLRSPFQEKRRDFRPSSCERASSSKEEHGTHTVRGVLSEDDFLESAEEESLEGLRPSGAVAVKRITFHHDGLTWATPRCADRNPKTQELKTRDCAAAVCLYMSAAL